MTESSQLKESAKDESSSGSSLGSTASDSTLPRSAASEIVPQPSPVRFHDMDSLRAAMMLLGLVFHAAWFFMPLYFGNTITDVGGSMGYMYFFAWVHQFRMQVFFLIAGFFACLLVRKRGIRSFAKNRFMRIVVPFVLSMLTIWPLMKLQYLRGGLESGRIISDEPLMTQFKEVMAGINWANEWVMHLWFLYCLILIYAIAWVLKLLFDHLMDRSAKIRPRLESLVNRLASSHVGPFLLAVPIAACMAYDLTWFGIDSGAFKPLWAGVIAYWIFFSVGWCLYSKPEIIDVFKNRWPAYLLIGSIMSLLLCGYFQNRLMSGRISWFYPVILDTEIDYPSFRSHLLAVADDPNASGTYRAIWNEISPTYQEFVRERPNPTSDQLVGFTGELTNVTVMNPDFPSMVSESSPSSGDEAVPDGAPSPPIASELDPAGNRELLAKVTDGEVRPLWIPPMWIRAGYFYGYGLATWLMTFAMLGLFRQYLSNPSAKIRYLADSSYWLYLIHLPLQFEISIHVAQWQANSFLKFLIYNVITFVVLLPTYHYLVRPTWLGVLLNGRLYPLRKTDAATTLAS